MCEFQTEIIVPEESGSDDEWMPPCVEKSSVLRLATRLKMQHKQRRRAQVLNYQASLLRLPESPSRAELPELAQALPPRLDVLERVFAQLGRCLLYTSPSPRDGLLSRMPSSA